MFTVNFILIGNKHSNFSFKKIYTKFGVGKIFFVFLKDVSYAHQCCIYLIKTTMKL